MLPQGTAVGRRTAVLGVIVIIIVAAMGLAIVNQENRGGPATLNENPGGSTSLTSSTSSYTSLSPTSGETQSQTTSTTTSGSCSGYPPGGNCPGTYSYTFTSSSNTTNSASSCNECAPPSFWIDCVGNSSASTICKFQITQGASYSVSVHANALTTITFFGYGVISLPTLTCSGSNCPSQTFAFFQSQVCNAGALFCPSGDEFATINFITPGYYYLTFAYQTTPGGPQVSNSLTVLAK